jgi:hypothetical protein
MRSGTIPSHINMLISAVLALCSKWQGGSLQLQAFFCLTSRLGAYPHVTISLLNKPFNEEGSRLSMVKCPSDAALTSLGSVDLSRLFYRDEQLKAGAPYSYRSVSKPDSQSQNK